LYAPKCVNRPSAELADDTAAQAVVHSGAFETQYGDAKGLSGGMMPPPAAPVPMRKARGEVRLGALSMDIAIDAPSPIAAAAEARELGDLFEYRIAQPVTIR